MEKVVGKENKFFVLLMSKMSPLEVLAREFGQEYVKADTKPFKNTFFPSKNELKDFARNGKLIEVTLVEEKPKTIGDKIRMPKKIDLSTLFINDAVEYVEEKNTKIEHKIEKRRWQFR